MTVDLLHPALRPVVRRRTNVLAVVLAIEAGIALLLVALIAAVLIQTATARQSLARLDADMAAIEPQWAALSAKMREAQRLGREVKELRELSAAPPWADVLETLRGAVPPGMWFTSTAVDEAGAFEVVARTRRPSAVPEFVRRLQGMPGLNARLSATETARVGDVEVLQATITGRVDSP